MIPENAALAHFGACLAQVSSVLLCLSTRTCSEWRSWPADVPATGWLSLSSPQRLEQDGINAASSEGHLHKTTQASWFGACKIPGWLAFFFGGQNDQTPAWDVQGFSKT
jgi:hypothetical protein